MSDQETELWQKAQDLFARAIELPGDKRAGFVETQSVGDDRLKTEVLSLLEAFEPGEAELEHSPVHIESPTTDETYAVPHDLVPGYEIQSELHRGGQGVVYKATQLGTGRDVALKFLLTGPLASEAERRRFAREVDVTCQLEHPGIVPVFDSGVAQHQRYFVMPFVAGLRLDDFLAENRLATDEVLRLFAEICDAVGHAHSRQIVHRDLKPSNVVVSQDGRPHVLDFGLAKTSDSDIEATTLSITGQVMGTLNYMSPEQAVGANRTIDTRSDVYSLGVLLYELLAGRIPYDLDGSLAENLTTIQNAACVPLTRHVADLSEELGRIVSRALSREPDDRYSDANELRADLVRFLESGGAYAASTRRNWISHSQLAIVGVLATVIIAVCVVLALDQKPPPDSVPAPLQRLASGELYSNSDLESQLTAMKNLALRDVQPSELLSQFNDRFGRLELSKLDESLTDERRKDLQFILEAHKFLRSDPDTISIAEFQQQAAERARQLRPTGMARDIVEDVLAAAGMTD